MKDRFTKRIFTARLLLADIGFLLTRIPWMGRLVLNKSVTRRFVERIMTVTTAVNGCTYCTWFHARAAVASGISSEEVRNLFNLQFQASAPDFEMVALLYAQHYAETNRHPDDQLTARLLDTYGERTATDIQLVIRMIFFGNLFGNTWDAVLSRFKGAPAPESNVVFELGYFFLTFWFMFPAMWLMTSRITRTGVR